MKCGNFYRSDYYKNGQAGDQCPLLGYRISKKGSERVSWRKKQNKNEIMEPTQSLFLFVFFPLEKKKKKENNLPAHLQPDALSKMDTKIFSIMKPLKASLRMCSGLKTSRQQQ